MSLTFPVSCIGMTGMMVVTLAWILSTPVMLPSSQKVSF